MIAFDDLEIGQPVYVNIDDEWYKSKITTLIGDKEPNPGRELVEIHSPIWGYEIFDTEDVYPASDFRITYKMVDIVERVPDERVYEFGIGSAGNAEDPYYTLTQETKPTGQKKMVLLKKCDGCGGEFPREWMMNASAGLACPDCYDRMS